MILSTIKPVMTVDSMTMERKEELVEKNILFLVENFFLSDIIEEIVNPEKMKLRISVFFEKEVNNIQIYIFVIEYANENESILVPGYLLSSNPYDKDFLEYLSKNEEIILPVINYAENKNGEIEVVEKPAVYNFKINDNIQNVSKNIYNAKPGILFDNINSQVQFLKENGYPDPYELFYLLNTKSENEIEKQ